ncbi:MAG: hypothetical protein ACTSO7_10515 [Candidatus Heimdallarchaeota archaeon]
MVGIEMDLTESEYRVFKQAIQKYFEEKKKTIIFIDDYTLELQTEDEVKSMYYLDKLAKLCKQETKENWSKIVTEFYDKFENYDLLSKDLQEHKEDFEFYKQYIGVRLYPKDYFMGNDFSKNYLYLPLLEDVYLALVLDFPDHVTNLNPKLPALWKKSVPDLLVLGIANILKNYQSVTLKRIVKGVPVYLTAASHYFSNIKLFDLDNHKELVGKYGSLICIPNRHETYIHPINGVDVEKALEWLTLVAKDRYKEPGALSQNLYWLHNKEFSKQDITFEENKVFIRLSKDFKEMLTAMKTTADKNKSQFSYL